MKSKPSYNDWPKKIASKPNYLYQHEVHGFSHVVKRYKVEPKYPSFMTNHMRHRERQIAREVDRDKLKEGTKA